MITKIICLVIFQKCFSVLGHTSKTFLSGPLFWRYVGLIWPNKSYIEIYIYITSKPLLGSKSFRSMTPQKGGFEGQQRHWGLKFLFWPNPKITKNGLSQKLDLYDFAANSWGLQQYQVTRSSRPFQWRTHLIKICF